MKAVNFYKDSGLKEVDIIIDSPVTYETASKEAKKVRADDLRLPLISLEHLIEMKQRTGRTIDNADVADLKKIKKLRKEP
jgi:hypothetical protein